MAGKLGLREHVMTAYGDEEQYIDPWQLFSEKEASEALEIARKSVEISQKFYDFYFK